MSIPLLSFLRSNFSIAGGADKFKETHLRSEKHLLSLLPTIGATTH